jgi:hypothetical protein
MKLLTHKRRYFMTTELVDKMNEVTYQRLSHLQELPAGSKEAGAEVETIARLSEQITQAYKADADYDQKIKELDLENQKNADEKKDRRIGMVIQVATTAVSGLAWWKMLNRWMKFEADGNIPTSKATLGLFGRIMRIFG